MGGLARRPSPLPHSRLCVRFASQQAVSDTLHWSRPHLVLVRLGMRRCIGLSADNLFARLQGVDIDASKSEIKSAYQKMAQEHHPDKNPDDPEAHERFMKIKAAFDAIKDGVGTTKQEVGAETQLH